jgi:hypothetical protein
MMVAVHTDCLTPVATFGVSALNIMHTHRPRLFLA